MRARYLIQDDRSAGALDKDEFTALMRGVMDTEGEEDVSAELIERVWQDAACCQNREDEAVVTPKQLAKACSANY